MNFIYVTAGSMEEAVAIGRSAVEKRLAACANLLPGVRSIYQWEGAVEEAAEVVLILKTRPERVEQLVEMVREMHSYDCPCVVALPISAGNPDYLAWISQETT
jgi:periplasmic divalent cation tolerance protein